MATINLYSNLNILKASHVRFGSDGNSFPENPQLGQFSVVNGALYYYTQIKGISTWYPLTTPRNSYVHVQGIESTTWTINHNLGSVDILYFVYDQNDVYTISNVEAISSNQLILSFSEAIRGKVVIFAAIDDATNAAIQSVPSWTVINSNYQSIYNQYLLADTTNESFTIYLPINPSENYKIVIADYNNTFGLHNLIVSPGTENILGVNDTFIIDKDCAKVEFIYTDSLQGWIPLI